MGEAQWRSDKNTSYAVCVLLQAKTRPVHDTLTLITHWTPLRGGTVLGPGCSLLSQNTPASVHRRLIYDREHLHERRTLFVPVQRRWRILPFWWLYNNINPLLLRIIYCGFGSFLHISFESAGTPELWRSRKRTEPHPESLDSWLFFSYDETPDFPSQGWELSPSGICVEFSPQSCRAGCVADAKPWGDRH